MLTFLLNIRDKQMSLLQSKIFNQILLIIFGAALLYFLYLTVTDPANVSFNLFFFAVALVGFFKTLSDLKKARAKEKL